MAGKNIVKRVTVTEFSALDANDFEDGQQVRITDGTEEFATYEAIGADGARTFKIVVPDPSASNANAVKETVDTDAEGVFQVTLGTPWQIDATDGLSRWISNASFIEGRARFAVDANGLPYLEAID